MDIEELKLWQQADDAIKTGLYKRAINILHLMPATGKITFNKAWVYHALNQYDTAIKHLDLALTLDKYLAIAYQLRAMCRYELALQGDTSGFVEAINDFRRVIALIKDNKSIDYTQLDNPTILHHSHTLYNIALMQKLSMNMEQSIITITQAFKLDASPTIRHAYIKSEFVGVLDAPASFGVSQAKIRNLGKKAYLKNAKIVLNLRGSVQAPRRRDAKSGGSLHVKDDVDSLLLYYLVD